MKRSKSEQIRRRLLKRAYREGRAEDMIMRIKTRRENIKNMKMSFEKANLGFGLEELTTLFEVFNGLQPQALRAHNIRVFFEGGNHRDFQLDPKLFQQHIERN